MRLKERIDNFLKLVNWHELIINRWKLSESIHNIIYYDYDEQLKNLEEIIIPYWKENYDQRIGQVLINLGFILDDFKIWNDEEYEILESQEIPLEEFVYWVSIFDKDGNRLEEPIAKLIKDLDIDHIRNIIKYFEIRNIKLPNKYLKTFIKILSKNEE